MVYIIQLYYRLGARVDGQGNQCSQQDGYIMSGRPPVTGSHDVSHHHQFSECSKQEIKQFLNFITL